MGCRWSSGFLESALPFEEYGRNLVAHLYNSGAKRHDGKHEAVYNSKRKEDCLEGTCVLDFERGLADAIEPNAWHGVVRNDAELLTRYIAFWTGSGGMILTERSRTVVLLNRLVEYSIVSEARRVV